VSPDVPEIALDLYAAPPEDFVASRNALAKQLKADGDDAAAAIVAKLRRPTVAASLVNVAARAHPDLVTQLLDAGTRLAGVQRKLLSGKDASEELRAVSDERRRFVRALTDAAITDATDAGRAADHLRDEVAGTFEAATLDDDLGERVRRGVIERTVTPSAGLSGLEGFALIPGGGDAAPDETEPAEDPSSRAQRAAERALDEARRARADADEAAGSAAEAAAEADRLSRAAEDAERAARDARSEERRLRDEASTARRRAERAERAARAAAERASR